jgi:hypothetical protein
MREHSLLSSETQQILLPPSSPTRLAPDSSTFLIPKRTFGRNRFGLGALLPQAGEGSFIEFLRNGKLFF